MFAPPAPDPPTVPRRPGLLRRGTGWILTVAAVVVALPLFFLALFVAAGTSGSRVVAYLSAALVSGAVAIGLALLSVRVRSGRGRGRRRLTAGVCAVLTLATGGGLAWAWFGAPVTYRPLPESADVRYWNLADGTRIAYVRTAGSVTHREPILIVHGGPGAPSAGNSPFARRLAAAGYDVYSYEQVGAGRSSRLPADQYTVARHVSDLDAVRTKLGVRKVVLIGSSWGGHLVAAYMVAHPDNVADVVLASPAALWANSANDRLTAGGQADQRATILGHPRFAATLFLGGLGGLPAARTLMSDRTADGLYQHFVRGLNMSSGCPGHSRGDAHLEDTAGYALWVNVATSASTEKEVDPRPALRRNTTPTLVLRAQCDYLSWAITREYRDILPKATLTTVNGAGHTVLAQKPDETGADVIAFLAGKPLPDRPYTGSDEPWSRP
jgi:proline iminopeptidase